jgi:3-hydroxyacyl-[acyl-carrier-protein] dehydratase
LRARHLHFRKGDDMSDDARELRSADIGRIMQLLPHRYPFLLVDRIIDMHEDQSCIGIKNVTINEPFFQGHFPAQPVMPGVLLIEAMAQTAGALALDHMGVEAAGQLVFFMTIDNAKFRGT